MYHDLTSPVKTIWNGFAEFIWILKNSWLVTIYNMDLRKTVAVFMHYLPSMNLLQLATLSFILIRAVND